MKPQPLWFFRRWTWRDSSAQRQPGPWHVSDPESRFDNAICGASLYMAWGRPQQVTIESNPEGKRCAKCLKILKSWPDGSPTPTTAQGPEH